MRRKLNTIEKKLSSSDINRKLLAIIKAFDAEVVSILLPFGSGSKEL